MMTKAWRKSAGFAAEAVCADMLLRQPALILMMM